MSRGGPMEISKSCPCAKEAKRAASCLIRRARQRLVGGA